jgi:hypothetical protein
MATRDCVSRTIAASVLKEALSQDLEVADAFRRARRAEVILQRTGVKDDSKWNIAITNGGTEEKWYAGFSEVLSQVHPSTELTDDGLKSVSDYVCHVADSLLLHCVREQNVKITDGVITDAHLLVALPVVLDDKEIYKHAKNEGRKAVTKLLGSNGGTAGLQFDHTYIGELVHTVCDIRATPSATAYLAAVLEYMSAEVLELSGTQCSKHNANGINLEHVLLAVQNDEELAKIEEIYAELMRKIAAEKHSEAAAQKKALEEAAAAVAAAEAAVAAAEAAAGPWNVVAKGKGKHKGGKKEAASAAAEGNKENTANLATDKETPTPSVAAAGTEIKRVNWDEAVIAAMPSWSQGFTRLLHHIGSSMPTPVKLVFADDGLGEIISLTSSVANAIVLQSVAYACGSGHSKASSKLADIAKEPAVSSSGSGGDVKGIEIGLETVKKAFSKIFNAEPQTELGADATHQANHTPGPNAQLQEPRVDSCKSHVYAHAVGDGDQAVEAHRAVRSLSADSHFFVSPADVLHVVRQVTGPSVHCAEDAAVFLTAVIGYFAAEAVQAAARLLAHQSQRNGDASCLEVARCRVCLEGVQGVVFVPCGHVCACRECAGVVMSSDRKCPVCRAKARSTMNVYLC